MKISRTILASAASLALFTMISSAQAATEHHREMVEAQLANKRPYVAQEFIVRFKDDVPQAERDALLSRAGAKTTKLVAMKGLAGSKHETHLAHGATNMQNAMAILNTDSRVEYAEPNWVFKPTGTPLTARSTVMPRISNTTSAVTPLATATPVNDPYFSAGYLWNMYGASTSPSSYYGTGAMAAWQAGHTCSNYPVYVGVIDQGVSIAHPDLKVNIWTNPADRADGKDNDMNGYVDDVNGYNFLDNNNNVNGSATEVHGTHVAGIIGAQGNNGVGVAGVCWSIRIIPAKFMDANGGTLANAIRAIDYLTDLKVKKGIKLVATNNSWGGNGYSQALYDAIDRARAADILFIAAAGNGDANGNGINNDITPNYPSSYTNANVISVAAIDKTGALAKFSNYGATSVHLAAPGVDILSTIPTSSGFGYGYMSGTSMAAPHVTAAAAMYAASHPTATAAEIKQAILSSVRPDGALLGRTVTGGVLDVSKF